MTIERRPWKVISYYEVVTECEVYARTQEEAEMLADADDNEGDIVTKTLVDSEAFPIEDNSELFN